MTYGVSYQSFYCHQFQSIMPCVGGVISLRRCQELEKDHYGVFFSVSLFMCVNSLHLVEVYRIKLGLLFSFGSNKIFFYFVFSHFGGF